MKPLAIDTTDLIGYFFAAAVTFSCLKHLKNGGLKQDFAVFADRKLIDWVQIVIFSFLACGSLVLIAYFSDHFYPVFQFSLLNLLATDHKPAATNLVTAGMRIPIFGLFFIPLLFLNLPRLAAAEEESFRLGTKNWLDAIPRSIAFGLMHMIVGVPVWVGLALALPGMWFTWEYFKGGLSRATMAHSVYNMILAGVVFVYVASLLVH